MGIIRWLIAAAFLGLPAGCAAAQQAMLWIPAQTPGAEEIVTILEENKNLHLTAAFTILPENLEKRLEKLKKDGRLELALRLVGDPPLPLLYYPALETVKWEGKPSASSLAENNRQFLVFRLSRASAAAKKDLKKVPVGLVIPQGGMLEDYFPLARSIGVKWLATGPLASTAAAVFEAGGISAVPFIAFSTAAQAGNGLHFTVFDETSGQNPSETRALLAAELSVATPGESLTVSEALKVVVSSAASPAEITRMSVPWSGDYTPWASAQQQKAALAALAKTRSDLMLYLNACGGSYSAAEPAFDKYFAAEDGETILMLASENPDIKREAETGLKNAIANSYGVMDKTPPRWSIVSTGGEDEIPEKAGRIYIKSGPDGFEIKNISRVPELPVPAPHLPGTADPYKIWKLDRFKVEMLADSVVFRFYPLEVDNSSGLASGFGHIALDLYIDINRRPRAGRNRPLRGRPFRFVSDSAWEYALEINPVKAVLYAVTPGGTVIAGSFLPKVEEGAVTIRVPRSALKGNPRLWGYSALMLAPKDAKSFFVADYIAAGIFKGYIRAIRPGRK
ncbi:MAG: glucodextranase DOMON-like domain-containing protein [Elusimicrobiota bacterium]|nr:glucodextranase DOMON-like domain-containing protein [Elusimicrobiota bacterium]